MYCVFLLNRNLFSNHFELVSAMKIGEKIRAIRQLKGLNQENMANMLNMNVLAYGDIERCKTDIKFSRLEQISAALKVTVCDIGAFDAELKTQVQSNVVKTRLEQQHEVVKLQLENQLLKAKLEKAELEVTYWREKSLLP